ncbi:glycosyltransferase family 4 protein [Coraliomargarita algicola]|uniref:Glycosyltransferase family 4 protein n=1 Tax=Coraliomargarita algicola TaxID=3092156 RepID=A0ABZ0RVB3_9BACT|nr:glycosyltransferase family 4 protein [Coraliomargarita sp. J2-16]WPJ96904.1 glycosyltransferase family 4 protein [Coraliomargarita sp. J2-16]
MKTKLAIITSQKAGWKTIRYRVEAFFKNSPDFEVETYHLEDYFPKLRAWLKKKNKLQTLGFVLAGRAAVNRALKNQPDVIFFTTLHDAMLMPMRKGVRYYIYSDCTPQQLTRLNYENKSEVKLNAIHDLYEYFIKRKAKAGAQFLCFSQWNCEGLTSGYGIDAQSVFYFPPLVDTEKWKPSPEKTYSKPLKVLFVGADFRRKGGDLILEAAAKASRSDYEWHFMTSHPIDDSAENIYHHRQVDVGDEQHLQIFRDADVLVLPTRADALGIVIIEGFACGLPAIATNVGGISGLIDDQQNGFILKENPTSDDLLKALGQYLDNFELLRSHAEHARAKAESTLDEQTMMQWLHDLMVAVDGPVKS